MEKGKGLGESGSGEGREERLRMDLGDLRRPVDLMTEVEDIMYIFSE